MRERGEIRRHERVGLAPSVLPALSASLGLSVYLSLCLSISLTLSLSLPPSLPPSLPLSLSLPPSLSLSHSLAHSLLHANTLAHPTPPPPSFLERCVSTFCSVHTNTLATHNPTLSVVRFLALSTTILLCFCLFPCSLHLPLTCTQHNKLLVSL